MLLSLPVHPQQSFSAVLFLSSLKDVKLGRVHLSVPLQSIYPVSLPTDSFSTFAHFSIRLSMVTYLTGLEPSGQGLSPG